MEVSTAKVISIIVLGLGSFIAGMAPACIPYSARQRHPLSISCLLCFGGGVLLSTSLTHMLPEAREKLPNYTELLLCVGFLLVYVVDELVHFFYGTNEHQFQRHERIRSGYGTVEHTGLIERRNNDGEMRERCCGDTGNPRMCHVSHTEPCNKSASGVVGLLCALFVHSLLEGLAIGLQKSTTQVLLLLSAVASHKFVVGFCLGAELCASAPGRLCAQLLCVTIFSGGSVGGITMGAVLDNVNSIKESIAVPIMQALAAGTLLYVTVSEVLPRERARWHERKRSAGMAQFVAVTIGFAVMYLLAMFLDHDAV